MDNKLLENKLQSSSKRMLESVKLPNNIYYKPTMIIMKRFKRQKIVKSIITTICTITIFAFTGNMLFIPGLGVFNKKDNRISHSIEKAIKIEDCGNTHEIISGYIMKNRIYLDVFYYNTSIGITFDNSRNSNADYDVYYNGEKCKDYKKSYGNSYSLSYKMPSVSNEQTIVISLYNGNKFLSNIKLYPTSKSEIINKNRPYTTVNDITLSANAINTKNGLQVYVSAILPKAANRKAYVNNSNLGFSESEVYIIDNFGNKYNYIGYDFNQTNKNEAEKLYSFYHFYKFQVPSNITDLKLIVTQVSYLTKDYKKITIDGPWELSIR